MKILMIAPEQLPLPSLASGSVETCMYHIAVQLAKRHHITIVSRQHLRYRHKQRRGNLTITRVRTGKPRFYVQNVLKKIQHQRFDWIQIDNRPQFLPIVRKKYPTTPIALFLHSLNFVTPPKAKVKIVTQQLKHADLIICNSRSLKKEIARRFPQHRAKLRHVLLGVDTRQFRPPTKKERRRVRRKKQIGASFAVVYAGRIIKGKGLPVLIKAMKKVQRSLPQARLIIAGKGNDRAYIRHIKKLSFSLRPRPVFLGSVSRNNMREVYWAADCFVCPSQKHEAFGLVVAEAMASGVPCVVSNNGGLREIINQRSNGLLVKRYRSADAFATAIVTLGKQQVYARKLARTARHDAVRNLNWKKTADMLEAIYRRGV